jgi:DNA-binding GntR family transcriptional regulator
MEAQGLITHYAGRGAFVSDITLRDLEEIFDLRMLMELFALETACRRLDDSVLNSLEKMLLDLADNSSPKGFSKPIPGCTIPSCRTEETGGWKAFSTCFLRKLP